LKIIVRNLARETTQAELLALFQAQGRVQSCTIVMDAVTGGSKGFGFVNMPVPYEAKTAIRTLNNIELGRSRIRVKKAQDVAEADPSAKEESAKSEPHAEIAAPGDAAAARARIKKDGTPLGFKKPRTFSKKKQD
jgi:RNA recognition motif-containing protein